ncbi:sulfatase [soil metagenome]
MTSRSALYLVPVVLAAVLAAMSPAVAAPNIVFFVVDDMSPDTGAYGNPAVKTPHLDALAAGATRFTSAFATTASCSASRSVILTGIHNHRNGHYGHQHDFHGFESWRTMRGLPILLEECGYRTAQIGKLHVAPAEVYRFGQYLKGNPRNAVAMAENAREFIADDADGKPFFLYIATSDPHRGGGRDESSPYRPDLFGNRPDRGSYPGVTETFYDPADVIVPPFLPDTPETRAELAQYYQSISRIDQGVGRLIEILRETGKWDETLFVFTSDHGMAFSGAKTNVYEPALHVPFIVRHPSRGERGGVNNAMISFVDIAPTLLDAAGGYDAAARAPLHPDSRDLPPARPGDNFGPEYTGFHGRSFLPVLGEENPEGWDEVAASHTFHEIQMYYPMRVVRDREFKLIWNIAYRQPFPFASDLWAAPSWQAQWEKGSSAPYGQKSVGAYIQRPQFELYHLADDPNESTNLAGDSNYEAVLADYQAKIKAMQRATDDPWVMKWEYE